MDYTANNRYFGEIERLERKFATMTKRLLKAENKIKSLEQSLLRRASAGHVCGTNANGRIVIRIDDELDGLDELDELDELE